MDFYLFTKSRWDEAPRLRHQVAQLLASQGHELLFFEKPGTKRSGPTRVADHITTVGTRWLLHPQLRVTRPMSAVNNTLEMRDIRHFAAAPPRIGIVNFNYDYEFLRRLYPDAKIVTIINDDFIDGARWFARREATRVLRATALMSNQNLAVSYPLVDQLRRFTSRAELFLPWSRAGYTPPPAGRERPDVLYWGYINDRIDAAAARHILDSGIKVHFVGPVTPSAKVSSFLEHANATHRAAASLPELKELVDRCSSTLLPYDITFKQIAAITMNNRAFELLSFGLPLLYADLPGLIAAPANVIYRCPTPQSYVEAIRAARESFDASQPHIERFLQGHSGTERYEQLMGYFR